MSKWKPGQLVTIDHHVYRVAKNNEPSDTCYKCDLFDRCDELDSEANFNCVKLVGVLCYFKRII